ncbi:MAG: 4-alpha-glucanotransferase [Peptococcaceae bacterium]|nr:4-alpha-glucanotransferase [Peptococcaceae bacterium]
MDIFHDSHNGFFREPFGAVPCGETVTLRLAVRAAAPVRVWVRLWMEGCEELVLMRSPGAAAGAEAEVFGPAAGDYVFWEGSFVAPDQACLFWYYFVVEEATATAAVAAAAADWTDEVWASLKGVRFYYGSNGRRLGGIGAMAGSVDCGSFGDCFHFEEPPAYQITVFGRDNVAPAWYKQGIMYQIFVDRFHRGGGPRWQHALPGRQALFHQDWHDAPFYVRNENGGIDRWLFFGGNLDGVRQKLSYLRGLGVSILYLNPIFEAASNHKYDTGDYLKVDPLFGDEESLRVLVEEAREQGISLVLDGVFSHTGADSRYFNRPGFYPELGAYQSEQSPYAGWYCFERFPDVFSSWWGISDLPNVHEMEPSYLDFICRGPESVIRTWMRRGIRGWRLDVADELPDAFIRYVRAAMTEEDPEGVLIGEVWEDASHKVSYGELRQYFAGDELHGTMNYPFRALLLDFMVYRISAYDLCAGLMSLYENYPRENFFAAMNLLGSHDVERVLTLLGDPPAAEGLSEEEKRVYQMPAGSRALAVKRLNMLVLWQMAFPGVPCVYYGDEAGMEGFRDPYNRGPFPWGREDESIVHFFRRWMSLRREYGVLRDGDMRLVWAEDVCGFWRLERPWALEAAEATEGLGVRGQGSGVRGQGLVGRGMRDGECESERDGECESERDGRRGQTGLNVRDGENIEVEGCERVLVLINRSEADLSYRVVSGSRGEAEREEGNGELAAGPSVWRQPCWARPLNWAEADRWEVVDLDAGERGEWDCEAPYRVDLPALSARVLLFRPARVSPERPWLARAAGVLLPVVSLPSRYGVGDFGTSAYEFVDVLVNAGQKVWQMLPLNPLDQVWSPYQSAGAMAMSPLYVDPVKLVDVLREAFPELAELLPEVVELLAGGAVRSSAGAGVGYGDEVEMGSRIDYAGAEELKGRLLRQVFAVWLRGEGLRTARSLALRGQYDAFCERNAFWLEDYALFCALKAESGDLSWQLWDDAGLRGRDEAALAAARQRLRTEMEYVFFEQFVLNKQFDELRGYANKRGLLIMGDVPFYVAADSADCWAHQDMFWLRDGVPSLVAGVPPDAFAEDGQRWGNPLYRWDVMACEGFSWWCARMRRAFDLFDFVRLDHFRGFAAYWEIPAEREDAREGQWVKGPGRYFFEVLRRELGEQARGIVAEDLGFWTPEVKILREIVDVPGMRVLQFENGNMDVDEDTVFFSGTHDNETLVGCDMWDMGCGMWDDGRERRASGGTERDLDRKAACRELMEQMYASRAGLVILPVQDVLSLDNRARMNVPGTDQGNWLWRMGEDDLTDAAWAWLGETARRAGRQWAMDN